MGSFRFLLAILVLVSHTNKPVFGYNIGVFAVVSFFIISGYVMTALIDKKYNQPNTVINFYIDRALRLYPQFLLYVTINAIIIYFGLPDSTFSESITAQNIALTFTMLPLGYYMFGASNPDILPPAWSLGLELSFYIIFPAIIYLRLRCISFIISIAIFIAAYFSIIDTDTYGYRLLPGVLFIFLCGSFMYRPSKIISGLPAITSVASAILFLAAALNLISKGHHAVEVTAGIAVGIPMIYALSRIKFHHLDDILGNISYGVFLGHFSVIYLAYSFGVKSFDWVEVALIIIVSIALSVASYFAVERPSLLFRHKLRNRVARNAQACYERMQASEGSLAMAKLPSVEVEMK